MTMALVLHRADGASVSSTAFRRAAFGKDDPFARHREIAWEGPGAMSAGRTSFIGEIEVASYPHIETIVVVEGELTLTAAGAAPLVVGPQAGVVIGCGTSLHIQAGSRVRFVFCAAACELSQLWYSQHLFGRREARVQEEGVDVRSAQQRTR